MRRLLPLLIGIAALSLLVACGGDSASAKKKTPAGDAYAQTQEAQQTPVAGTPTSAATQEEVTPAMSFADACQKSDEKQFASAPPRIIDTAKTYVATIKTAKGDIVVELDNRHAVTTNNFIFLACKGFYDGLTFHRVEPGFVIQGGDPQGTGSGGPGYTIPDEDDDGHLMDEGVISMAKAGPNTTGSQFFVTTGLGSGGDLSYLDPDFTVFGEVTSGMDAAKELAVGDTITAITIEEQ